MAAEYYCLIAGLTEYSFADKNRNIELNAMRSDIAAELNDTDRRALALLYTYYDIQNVVNMLQNSSLPFNELGNLTPEQLLEEIAAQEVDDEPFQSILPSNIRVTLDKIAGRNLEDEEQPIEKEQVEKQLYTTFYKMCGQSSCRFIREWCETDRTIRNITTIHRAQELGIDPQAMVIGEMVDEREFVFYAELMAVLDTKDFVDRETKMDALRWQIAEQLTEHNYFDIDAVLCYLVKLNILYRWSALDKATGERRFRAIVESFTANTHIE